MVGPLRNIADTALWVAIYRALETERPDALFRDPYARRLAGERGAKISEALPAAQDYNWAWTMRTYLFDRILLRQIEQGIEVVLNLAAGLDTRPYRMNLPAGLEWIEVDLPQLFDYKEQVLGDAVASCSVERIRLDLSDPSRRREMFGRVGGRGKRVLVISEGFLIYLPPEQVCELAQDLAREKMFRNWIVDLVSPPLLRFLQESMGSRLEQVNAPYHFGPEEGAAFFLSHGWRNESTYSVYDAASKAKRLPHMTGASSSSDSKGRERGFWSGVCLLSPNDGRGSELMT